VGVKGWPPLTCHELAECLTAHGFELDRTKGSHLIYVHPKYRLVVPIDTHWDPAAGPTVKHVVEDQARLSRDAFYGATKATAKKIGKRWKG
jgi:predicted RNA binding protein YcfA (HicA-like mRNA interferase family)